MKRITKRQAERLVKSKWGDVSCENDQEVEPLCGTMPDPLLEDWEEYWIEINTDRCGVMPWYDGWFFGKPKPCDFLRLLTVHLFIRHTYED